MDFGIGGKVALVTGATKGIGLGIAQALAREGVRVSVVARTEADVKRVAHDINGFGVAADVTTDEGCKTSVEQKHRETSAPSTSSSTTSARAQAARGVTQGPKNSRRPSTATLWSARA